MEKIKCLVVDDEELARNLLETYIDRIDFLECAGSAESPVEAMEIMREINIDLLFLDIQMPEIKGTDFAKMIAPTTQIIFTTAYSEYAVEGFELNALDYLLKPITFERFLKSVSKIKTETKTSDQDGTITVKSGYDLHKLKYDDILYIESDSEYVIYYSKEGKLMSNQSLKSLENMLPKEKFMRVHRSYIINKTKVSALKGRDLIIGKVSIPVSAKYFDLVRQELF
ncbi:LytR/AlgR family response regulator transcription factor [Kriegella aquimaris]|uniref:Two component transcriptional regulator, LytTR family n=1 Tax=Kriegella aquimaris TaxID=192904 RepID=A0A1G9S5C2_9FLAO|nr:LytTR family DNA-binding domain-containing protein [Kriegella aquimaris]SDM30709.1 two component transcriptional regulator, LytTR family [Kriegella aquimaris]